MKLSTYILPILAAGLVSAGSVPGPNTYVKVRYEDGMIRYFDFGECYPYKINGANAEVAVWSQSTTCRSKQGGSDGSDDDTCTGITTVGGVPIPGGTVLVNAADFVHLIGQGAICDANPGLPSIPIEPEVLSGLGL